MISFLTGLVEPLPVAIAFMYLARLTQPGRRSAPRLLSTAAWWAAAAAGQIVSGLALRSPGQAAGGAISLALAAAMWLWLRRRRRGRAGHLTGAKARALRDALVRRARESAGRRPVLRPSLKGA